MSQQTSLRDTLTVMMNQSKDVLLHPSEQTFERYEKQGTIREAALYVGVAALIAGLLGLVTRFAVMSAIGSVLYTLTGFFIFTSLVFYIGKQQGGTGKFDEVAYTFALFIAPLSLILPLMGIFTVIPVLGAVVGVLMGVVALLLLFIQAYFAYIAVRSSMNLVLQQAAFITLGGAVIATFILQVIIGILFF